MKEEAKLGLLLALGIITLVITFVHIIDWDYLWLRDCSKNQEYKTCVDNRSELKQFVKNKRNKT